MTNFRKWPINPNDVLAQGGTVISPHHKNTDQEGPYFVFEQGEFLGPEGVPAGMVVIDGPTARDIATALLNNQFDPIDARFSDADIRQKIGEAPAITTDFEDLPDEEQAKLQASFPGGGPTKTAYGVVDVPRTGSPIQRVQDAVHPAGQAVAARTPALDVLAEAAQELPLEVPGPTPGTWEPVHDPAEVPDPEADEDEAPVL